MSSSEGSTRRAWSRRVATIAFLAPLAGWSGCGFRLRHPARLSFGSIALVGFAPRSPLAEELRLRLSAQVKVLPSPDRADVVLLALTDLREKSVVATTAAAQVREFELRLKFAFRAQRPDGQVLLPKAELLLTRALSYNESQALAKEFEEAELYREMQTDLAMQVLTRLAAINL